VRKKVKVHPGVGRSTFGATEDAAVKVAGFVKVGDVECKMEKAVHDSKHISPNRHGQVLSQ
jgi:hypothetical protein